MSCNAEEVFSGRTYRKEVEVRQCRHFTQAFVNNKGEHFGTNHEEDKDENISKATLIWRAIKLPIYFVAVIPLTVSSSDA